MAWTAVASPYFSTGQVVNATNMNALSDNLRYLKGTDGPITFDDRITTPATTQKAGAGWRAVGASSVEVANLQGYDASGTSAIFFSTNRQFDGSAWQQLNTRAGGVVQITQDEFAYYTFPASSSTPTNRFQIKNTGYVGIGTSAPQGMIDIAGAAGHGAFFSADAVGGTAVTLAIAGTVSYGASMMFLIRDSAGTVAQGITTATVLSGNYNMVADGTNTYQFQVSAGGAISVQRTLGSRTFKIAGWALWI